MCSCPAGGNCKHVPTLLLQVLVEPQPVAARPFKPVAPEGVNDAPLRDWLAGLEQALRPAPVPAAPAGEHLLYILKLDRRFELARLRVDLVTVRRLKAGGYGKPQAFRGGYTAPFLTLADRKILT